MKIRAIALGIATVASLAAAAYSVTFDSSTGTGFVGKGDVQSAFGWNNKQLQDNASGVRFVYNSRDTYDVECEWTTITGGPNPKTIYHDITIPKHASINATVDADARMKNQITGFILNGFGATVVEGTVPVLGGACPGNHPGTITGVTLTSSVGGLSVTYGSNSVPLL